MKGKYIRITHINQRKDVQKVCLLFCRCSESHDQDVDCEADYLSYISIYLKRGPRSLLMSTLTFISSLMEHHEN